MEVNKKNRLFGLLGKDISYSFSRAYFSKKFKYLNLTDCEYINFDISKIALFPEIITKHKNLRGMNVTIPYKKDIIPFLKTIDSAAREIGAVNTILVTPEGLSGYNTDHYGFEQSLLPHLKSHHQKALILGTGGASSAVAFVLNKLGIDFKFVSRTPYKSSLGYEMLSREIIATHTLIINCTPLGTFPKIALKPNLPYHYLTKKHLLYDLVYNPPETSFIRLGKSQGGVAINGLKMLEIQAEKSWNIWQ